MPSIDVSRALRRRPGSVEGGASISVEGEKVERQPTDRRARVGWSFPRWLFRVLPRIPSNPSIADGSLGTSARAPAISAATAMQGFSASLSQRKNHRQAHAL
jgi:hypothetical protein